MPIALVIDYGQGLREDVVLEGTGGTIRCAIGEPGRQSGVWRIWANKSTSDVYIAARPTAGVQKFSLHESGDWRLQWVNAEHAERYTARLTASFSAGRGQPRASAGGPRRSRSGYRDRTSPTFLTTGSRAKGFRFPDPGLGKAAAFHIVIAKTDRGHVPVRGAAPFGAFALANGEVAVVLVAYSDLTEDDSRWLDMQRMRAHLVGGVGPKGPSLLITG